MIQYNNFLMKREQSRAGSRFAECEKSRLKAKILITLALLLTAVTGAWADGTVTVTELKASEMPTSWANNSNPVKATDLPGFTAVTRDEAKALGAPAAVSGLEIAADAAIITAGQSAQGTLLYAVTTSETKPALTAFSPALPNAKDQTAAGTYYVWYYIQGHDTPQGQEPSADNTFNDSEIMGPLTVELLTNEHTLNIKQSPNITVTVAGTAKTPTDDKVTPVTTGQEVKIKANEGYKFRKVEVKKKAAAAAPITVTWNNDDITGSGKSFTKDGVTVTADKIDFREKNFMDGGTFTTTLGNFTKIEVTTGLWNASGTGWSGSTWTGTPASSVSFSGDIYGMGYTMFVFTIEPTN